MSEAGETSKVGEVNTENPVLSGNEELKKRISQLEEELAGRTQELHKVNEECKRLESILENPEELFEEFKASMEEEFKKALVSIGKEMKEQAEEKNSQTPQIPQTLPQPPKDLHDLLHLFTLEDLNKGQEGIKDWLARYVLEDTVEVQEPLSNPVGEAKEALGTSFKSVKKFKMSVKNLELLKVAYKRLPPYVEFLVNEQFEKVKKTKASEKGRTRAMAHTQKCAREIHETALKYILADKMGSPA